MATEADFARIGNYARMYNKDQNIDRRKATRTVPLEVLCLGYSRTGTLSMHKAMTILGYPNPYHFSSIYDNTKDSEIWLEAVNAKYYGCGKLPDKRFFDGLLGHVGATCDMPCNAFAEELVTFYPDSKIVLVERDIESWYKSWMSFCQSAYDPMIFFLGRLDPFYLGRIAKIGAAMTTIDAGYSQTVDEARVRSKAAYKHHYQDVRDMVPKDRLLNFRLEEGWAPLCEFLGKPVPAVPFPHENDTKSNAQSFAELGQKALKSFGMNVVIALVVVGGPVAVALWYRRMK